MDIAVMRPALDDPGQTNVAAPVSTNTSIRETRPLLGSKASRHAGLIAYASGELKATRADGVGGSLIHFRRHGQPQGPEVNDLITVIG
jgi:hypothetical protein